MSTATDVAQARQAFEDGLAKLKESQTSEIGALRAQVDQIKLDQQTYAETLESYHARAAEPVGGEDELREYTMVDEDDYKRNKHAYIGGDEGALRLYGHTNRHGFWEYGLLDDPAPKHEWQKRAQDEMTRRNTVRALMRVSGDGRIHTPGSNRKLELVLAGAPRGVRKIIEDEAARIMANNDDRVAEQNRILSSGATGSGAEWVPQNLSPALERAIQHIQGTHSIFPMNELPPSGKMKLPRRWGNFRVYKNAAPTSNDPADHEKSDVNSGNVDIAATRLVLATQMDEDADEEVIYALAPETQADMARAFAFTFTDILTNGDDTGAHQDDIANWDPRGVWGSTGLGTSADHRRTCKGLRRLSFDKGSDLNMNSVQTEAGLRTLLATKLDARYGARLGDIKLMVNWEFLINTMWGWSEFKTWDQVGAGAVVLTGLLGGRKGPSPGSVGVLFGFIEVVVNPFLTPDLASTGKFTGSGTLTSMILVVAPEFEWRHVPGMVMQTAARPENSTITTLMKKKITFRDRAPQSSTKNVAQGINLTSGL